MLDCVTKQVKETPYICVCVCVYVQYFVPVPREYCKGRVITIQWCFMFYWGRRMMCEGVGRGHS